jgi:cytochrome c biogenesis protein CcmG/thiol:disulfide interchange protein DsbE
MYKFLIIIFFITSSVLAQNKYYKGPNGKIFDEATYLKAKRNLEKTNKVNVKILDIRTSKDSLIHSFEFAIEPIKNGQPDDPYNVHKQKIGQYFPIEIFSGLIGSQYTDTYLKGKPTVINFWFTGCVPCIGEIPQLNLLQQKFKNDANFIALTFDSADKVKAFVKKKPFHFKQIAGAKKQLADLKVVAYPMTLLLDRDRKIVKVYGDISASDTALTADLLKLIKAK